jgi:hypothetical protein
MKLLFVPLDIEVTETNFELGEQQTYHLGVWKTSAVIGKENNYQKYRNLLDQLPIVDITLFTHKIQQTKVVPHTDYHGERNNLYEHFIKNEPSGYHVVLKGQSNSLEIYNGKEWVTPILPKAPIAYLLNLTTCLHRVKEDILRETLYIQGWMDIEKHNQLIERSLNRYSDLAVYSKV